MGQDWVQARLLPGAPLAEVARLVREQAKASFDLRGSWESHSDFKDEAPPLDDADANQRFVECFHGLLQFVEPNDRPEGDGPREVRRTYAVTRNRVFPPEWRTEAMRSFLPDDLRDHLKMWRAYVDEVRRGLHRGYLRELLIHEKSLHVVSYWRELQVLATRARDRTNHWARKPAVIDVRERILATPEPPIHPAPVWTVWRERPEAFGPGTIGVYAALEASGPFAALFREWNYAVASNNRRSPHIWRTPRDQDSLEWQIAECLDSSVDETFEWLEPACADGMLLYFYG